MRLLLKWIVCHVSESERERFATAQEAWARIASSKGFLAQAGGWDRNAPECACIVSAWNDDRSYRAFMAAAHDEVADASGQPGTYDSVQTRLYEPVLWMAGTRENLFDCFAAGGGLRVAECRVRAKRGTSFESAQLEVWAPGMAATGGMLAGVALRSESGSDYLILSQWRDEAAHDDYCSHVLPGLRELARAEEDVEALVGRWVPLEPAWTVLPHSA
jgi:heme-degrading monooxygenase HmoA/quinol monooxygenase YgiN